MGTVIVWLAKYVTEKSLLTFDHQNQAKIRNKFSFVIVALRWLVSSYHLSLKGQDLHLNFSNLNGVRSKYKQN